VTHLIDHPFAGVWALAAALFWIPWIVLLLIPGGTFRARITAVIVAGHIVGGITFLACNLQGLNTTSEHYVRGTNEIHFVVVTSVVLLPLVLFVVSQSPSWRSWDRRGFEVIQKRSD